MRIFSIAVLTAINILMIIQCNFAQWIQTNEPHNVNVSCIISNGSAIFIGTDNSGIFLSTDNGMNWKKANNGITDSAVTCLTVSGANIFAGTGGGGIYRSPNNGNNWIQLIGPFTGNDYINSVITSNSTIIVGTLNSGIYISLDNGINWQQANNGLLPHTWILSLIESNNNIFVGSQNGIFRSSDNGSTWLQLNSGLPTDSYINTFAKSGINIFAGMAAGEGIYITTDYGNNWSQRSNGLSTYPWVFSITTKDSNIFATSVDGTTGNWNISISTNNGKNWQQVNDNLPINIISRSLAIIGGYVFLGTNNGVWRRPISELVTGINERQNNLFNSFSLRQNFPNPFNPTTTICYSVPKTSFVTIKVYDVLGKEIETLVNDEKPSGSYKVEFDGSKFTSGIYFYRMQAGSFVETKKLIVLK
ncbi:MAG: T9SS type A sorting domain-containing protein [Ignavibacteriaceae bacterium]